MTIYDKGGWNETKGLKLDYVIVERPLLNIQISSQLEILKGTNSSECGSVYQ